MTTTRLLLLALCILPKDVLLRAHGGATQDDVNTLARDRDPDKRCRAVEILRPQKTLRMVQTLLPLLADPHPRVRWRAMTAIRGATAEDCVKFLTSKALRHPDRHVRWMTLEALAGIRCESTIPDVLDRLEDADPEVRAQACVTLVALKAKEGADALLERFAKDRDGRVRAEALESLAVLDADKAAGIIDKAVSDKSYEVRMTASAASARLGLASIAATGVRDTDWRVRHAAIESCRKIRKRECIGPLIDQFATEKGRLRWDLYQALVDLAGRDLGLEAKPWKAWWEAVHDTFEPGAAGGAACAAPPTKAEFFNLPIFSNRILFILDLSGSMREPAPGKANTDKLRIAKDGMIATVRSLDDEVAFSMLGCGSDDDGNYLTKEQKTWRRQLRLCPATAAAKADAERWIDGVQAKGWTNLWDAIEYGFSDEQVDTIFLYSDGGASRGVWVAAGEILQQLRRMNRYRRIMINTVEVPGTKPNPPDNAELLKDIAAVTGGTAKLSARRANK